MKAPQTDRWASLRGRRGIVLFVAGALASGLAVSGIHAALAGGSSKLRARPTLAPDQPVAPPVVTDPVPSVIPAEQSPSAQPEADPNALGDGVYPTYVRAVDVHGGTITVDVLQVFVGREAHQAATEDGMHWKDVRYDPVYIRNENPLLRTFPVAREAHIKFLGTCESPSRWVGLTQLRSETTPLTGTFYYEVTVRGGTVVRIDQQIAIAAC